jgi:hypothetical protein
MIKLVKREVNTLTLTLEVGDLQALYRDVVRSEIHWQKCRTAEDREELAGWVGDTTATRRELSQVMKDATPEVSK